jgi:hypothetical protein
MSQPSIAPGLRRTDGHAWSSARLYRLVDQNGFPHPVLDDLYESLDAAWQEVLAWRQHEDNGQLEPLGIGIQVSTASGDWRTVRHPAL